MTNVMSRMVLAAAIVCVTAAASLAQTTATTSETKSFEVIATYGNTLVVRLPEGTRELTVPADFRFTVNGKQLSLQELQPGMRGTATIPTRTTVTPVTVTEVKGGTVVERSGSMIIVRTAEGVRSFTQGEVDKRGVKLIREGKPAELSQFRPGDQISATIITSLPPRVLTEKEVQAIVPTAAATSGAAPAAAPARPPSAAAASSAPTASSAAAAPSAARTASAPATQNQTASTLPKTASEWPLFALASALLLAMGLALTIRRRLVH